MVVDYRGDSEFLYDTAVLCKLKFWFFPGSPKMPLNMSELGLNIIFMVVSFYKELV